MTATPAPRGPFQVHEAARAIDVIRETDVLVVGSGLDVPRVQAELRRQGVRLD